MATNEYEMNLDMKDVLHHAEVVLTVKTKPIKPIYWHVGLFLIKAGAWVIGFGGVRTEADYD